MKVCVRVFALLRETVGADSVEMELAEASSVGDLRAALVHRYQDLRPLEKFLKIAVNAELAGDGQTLAPSDEIVILPPVSGG